MKIFGIDEAGRGALFGPLVVAGVVLPSSGTIRAQVADSKQLTHTQRLDLLVDILDQALSVTVVAVSASHIDKYNVLQATLYGMGKVVRKSPIVCDRILIDGNKVPFSSYVKEGREVPVEAIVKGDSKIPEISAASIVAKVVRDKLMIRYGHKYPGYLIEKHKGYGTKAHFRSILKQGLLPQHRRSFNLTKQLTLL